jgi:hypothetical protein
MAGLPKKYAKLGFKKGWKAFKASKRTTKRKTKSTRTRSSKVSNVRRRKSNGFKGLFGTALGAMAYGAGREMISTKLEPITMRIPAGEVADEVVMGALSYAMMKGKIPFIKNFPISREIGKAGFYIEMARIGNYLADNVKLNAVNTGSGSVPNSALQVTVF